MQENAGDSPDPQEQRVDFPRDMEPVLTGDQARSLAEFATAIRVCSDTLRLMPSDPPYVELRQRITMLATSASRLEIPPERLLAELKRLLSELPRYEAKDLLARSEMMDDLITHAIESYFAPRAD